LLVAEAGAICERALPQVVLVAPPLELLELMGADEHRSSTRT
jgi:hypothetical protein